MFLVAPFWKYGMFKLAGGAMYVNSWRFDLRYDALMAGCCLALILNDPGLSRLLSNKLFKSVLGALLALAAVGFGMVGLPVAVFSQSLSFVGVAVFINFAIQRPNGFVGGLLNGKPIIWIGQLSYSLYLWQQIFCWHSKLPWLGQFPQNIIASVVAAALSYYLLEIPLAEFRKTIPYLPNPRFLMRVIRSSRNLVQDEGLVRSNNSAHSDGISEKPMHVIAAEPAYRG